jgi:DNA polymerase
MKLWNDIETRSSVPIKRGIAKYATGATIIMNQWAIDDGPIHVEDLTGGKGPSAEYLDALAKADEIWAHGAEFEQQLIASCWKLAIEPTKWRCTMALARMHGLPGGLDKLSTIFKLGAEGKDDGGRELIQLFCIPRKDGKYNDRHSHPKQWQEFMNYGAGDIRSMRAVYQHCPKWNATPRMWRIWHLDQKMNARGVSIDLKLCAGAMAAAEKAKKRLKDRTGELTENLVEATTQRNRLLAYMESYGVSLPDLTADTVGRRLEDDQLPEHIKELLRIRQQASKSAGAKYKRALDQHVGGRLRNLLVFCGANRTGRWAGRTFQPQNLPRPKHAPWDIEIAIEAFRKGTIEQYTKTEVLGLANSALRGIMVADQDRRLVVADLANIEGRDMAWIAGEDWKLAAFAAFDQGIGPDLYKVSAGRAFGVDPYEISDTDWRRQIGKVMELALQYYGGVGAFCSMAETYGLRLEDLPRTAWPSVPPEFQEAAKAGWAKAVKKRRTYGLEREVWIVCQALVLMWREQHPAIVAFWSELENAVECAVKNPGKIYTAGRVRVDRVANWLRIRLPSGRYLNYPAPRAGDYDISFVGVDAYTKQWKRISTYSGKLAENIVQGSSADILMDGLVAADDAGFEPVLSVHDEIICEPPDDSAFDDKLLSQLMTESSPWAAGMPLAAKGFTGYRYAKH